MVMVHGDDQGLVLPPRVAPKQVVIMYIYKVSDSAEVKAALKRICEETTRRLTAAGVRVVFDDQIGLVFRGRPVPGERFNRRRGMPLRTHNVRIV